MNKRDYMFGQILSAVIASRDNFYNGTLYLKPEEKAEKMTDDIMGREINKSDAIDINLLNEVCKLMQQAFKDCKGVDNPMFTHTAGEIIRLVKGQKDIKCYRCGKEIIFCDGRPDCYCHDCLFMDKKFIKKVIEEIKWPERHELLEDRGADALWCPTCKTFGCQFNIVLRACQQAVLEAEGER